jgi:hypothetical protein
LWRGKQFRRYAEWEARVYRRRYALLCLRAGAALLGIGIGLAIGAVIVASL